ncbi:MAG: hypothetical protein LBM98_02850 [Oscillospiraceae bacterium]|nr:hypothetical protein [Oscillospiraceae bacterium]
MLRTCNVLRIASVPVLRKDGALRRDGGRWSFVGDDAHIVPPGFSILRDTYNCAILGAMWASPPT